MRSRASVGTSTLQQVDVSRHSASNAGLPVMDVLSNIDPTSSGFSSVDPYRPSFFELIAQDQLSSLLKPAIRYVLTVLAQRNPRYLLRIVNRFDEVYALIMLAVNRHYLRTWSTLCRSSVSVTNEQMRPSPRTSMDLRAGGTLESTLSAPPQACRRR